MQNVFRIRDRLKENERVFPYTTSIKTYVITNRVNVVRKLIFSAFIVLN
jgi:hypothetical protein